MKACDLQLLAAIIESSDDGIISKDLDGTILTWNPAAEHMFGYQAEEIIGQNIAVLVPGHCKAEEAEILEKVRKGIGVRNYETSRFKKDGTSLAVSLTISPVRDSSGKVVGASKIVRDITERKRTQEASRESEAHYRSLFENMLNGFAFCRMEFEQRRPEDFRYLEVNAAFETLTGLKNVVGRKATEVIPGLREQDPGLFEICSRVAQTGEPERFERYVQVLQKWFDIHVYSPSKDHFVAVFDVITERKRTDQELSASELRYRRLFEAAKDGLLILDAETGMVVDVNPFLVQLLGLPLEAFLGTPVWELGSFKGILANQASFEKLQQVEYIRYDDRLLEAIDGRRIDVEFVSNAYEANHQKVIQCNIRDITERKRTERQAWVYREQLRSLSARIETLREEERTRIAREIHDDLGQMLTGIKMDLRWMEHRLDKFGDDQRVNPILDKLVVTSELADATIKTVQRISADLRPGILDKLGLPVALEYEAARFEARTGIACRLVLPADTLALQSETATAFFRIFQEALTNVTRHARARFVEVELRAQAGGCRLEIRDDGQGMAGVDLTNPKALGLLGMQESADLLGGRVSFTPRPGGGTVVTVQIPNTPTKESA